MKTLFRSLVAICLFGSAVASLAQQFPSRPVKILVPYAAGGLYDIVARVVSPRLATRLGQPVIIDNKAGGGGAIAMDALKQSPPDGHTLLFADPAFLINPMMQPQLTYRVPRDLQPVAQFATTGFILAVHPGMQVTDVQGLARYARSHVINFYSPGIGSMGQLASELFKVRTGTDAVHVPYRGFAAALTDILSGQVHMGFYTPSVILPYVRDGRLRAIAVTGANRSLIAPEIPTMREQGIADFDVEVWMLFGTVAGTPPAVVRQLNQAIVEVGKSEEVRSILAKSDITVATGTPEDAQKVLEAEERRSAGFMKAFKIAVEK